MLLLSLALFFVGVCGQFEVPDALVEPLSPKGFRVSIPGKYDSWSENNEGVVKSVQRFSKRLFQNIVGNVESTQSNKSAKLQNVDINVRFLKKKCWK